MKLHSMEFPWGKTLHSSQNSPKTLILFILSTLLLLTLIPLYSPLLNHSSPSINQSTPKISNPKPPSDLIKFSENKKCDLFTGEWVPNPEAPYYTNDTCWAIHEHQNCMKYGRPDSEFMKWRWKPEGCDLQLFNPYQFLEIVRGKSMAFVGDSVGRNAMQSLICLLSRRPKMFPPPVMPPPRPVPSLTSQPPPPPVPSTSLTPQPPAPPVTPPTRPLPVTPLLSKARHSIASVSGTKKVVGSSGDASDAPSAGDASVAPSVDYASATKKDFHTHWGTMARLYGYRYLNIL